MSEYDEVLVEKREAALWIIINREARRNAIDDRAILAMSAALAKAEADDDVRAVVITAAGERAFCSGADLSANSGTFQFDTSQNSIPYARLLRQARELGLPIIARINGHCVAGGMGLLAMADMAVAADHAKFGLPEVKVGVFPMLVTSVLKDLIPPRQLSELALTGEFIMAKDALGIGLLNYVVLAAELDEKVTWLVNRLVDKSPTGIRRGKYAMQRASSMSFEEALAYLESQIAIMALTEDAAEGRKAFIEKRPPVWTGR
ncbi:MAG: enoyl-CoA hydratase/isomerase family protein [Nitratireductor sp.]|nr:enoyl-CoA hydratase/isomerase family protein [Nitratireductor sp.]